MTGLLAVCTGGALGAGLRYLLVTQIGLVVGRGFPWGTLAVNVLGSLLMGVLWVFLSRGLAPQGWQQFAAVGFLGAFTTFSAYSLELFVLLDAGRPIEALSYAGGSVVLCVAATALGILVTRTLLG